VPRRVPAALLALLALAADRPPAALDPRLVVEPFAAAPDIVQPIAATFDARGRLLVVESHTHFRPKGYAGPAGDRIRVLEDTNGDGKADRFTTFFEGTVATMDVAAHPDGAVYVATRNEILRLRDTDGDGVADEKVRIAFLDTPGNYPHDGLCGLSFDDHGDLHFGLGENLGEPYKLVGSDGTTLTGGGEGGSVFHCTADGKKLRRVARGFWNPFGTGRDIFGRLYAVDNDPDASPPCRLVRVVEGGDYGFQFRYGRAGRHPFQAWNGELPGTLPYVAGTGESPCEVVSYESDGLPPAYRGQLLVPAWADHRVERYAVRGTTAERLPFVQGGSEFRPSGLAVAPDGSLFVTDWVSRSYELHGKGAVWHVRWKDHTPESRPTEPKAGLLSAHRPTREAAARSMAKDEAGRAFLRETVTAGDLRTRAAALAALIAAGDQKLDLAAIARPGAVAGLREMAVRELAARGANTEAFAAADQPAGVRFEAVAGLSDVPTLLKLLADADPYLRHAATWRLARLPDRLAGIDWRALPDAKQRAGVVLVWRAAGRADAKVIGDALADPDPDVRLLAAKWVSDERLSAFRPRIEAMMKESNVDPRGFVALATVLARIDGTPVNEDGLATYFLARATDEAAPVAGRRAALRAVPAAHRQLTPALLGKLLALPDPGFRVEVLRAIADRADGKLAAAARDVARDAKQPADVRAEAVVAAAAAGPDAGLLLDLAAGPDVVVRREALRALTGAKLSAEQRKRLDAGGPDADLVARVLGKPFAAGRPPATDVEGWLKRLDGPADAEAGRRVFESVGVSSCSRCHRIDGRGANVGPDLSLIGRTDRRWIAESILQPSASVAPHFQAWQVETADGRSFTGLLVHTNLDESYYVDPKGDRIKVLAGDLLSATPAKTSVMPEGLLDRLTDQEARDLLAFLASRK
jgi:putative membrane-bound dehydrogenase-like protein